jgi:hypothetical protein
MTKLIVALRDFANAPKSVRTAFGCPFTPPRHTYDNTAGTLNKSPSTSGLTALVNWTAIDNQQQLGAKIMLKSRQNSRRRFGRPLKRLLSEGETGLLRPNCDGWWWWLISTNQSTVASCAMVYLTSRGCVSVFCGDKFPIHPFYYALCTVSITLWRRIFFYFSTPCM